MPKETWECVDARDSWKDRWSWEIYTPDEIASIKGGHWCIVYALCCPGGRTDGALTIERIVTSDPKESARALLKALAGTGELPGPNGHPDPNVAKNLRNRVALYQRDFGDCTLAFAVHYDKKVASKEAVAARRSPLPTDAMLEIVKERLATEGLGGHRWQVARTIDELPAAPHARTEFRLVGVDCKGMVNGTIPRPFSVEHAFGRDLPAVVRGLLAHPAYHDTETFCEERSLLPLFLWRFERAAQAA